MVSSVTAAPSLMPGHSTPTKPASVWAMDASHLLHDVPMWSLEYYSRERSRVLRVMYAEIPDVGHETRHRRQVSADRHLCIGCVRHSACSILNWASKQATCRKNTNDELELLLVADHE